MKRVYFVLLGLLLFLFAACEKKIIDLGSGEFPYNPNDSVYFNADLIPLFAASCVSCHSIGSGTQPELEASVAYNSLMNGGYVDTVSPANSVIYLTIEPAATTHSGGQFKSIADKVLIWIQQGARNN